MSSQLKENESKPDYLHTFYAVGVFVHEFKP